jgi:hypothetical protein
MKESYLRYKYDSDYKYKALDYVNYIDNSFSMETEEKEKDKPITYYIDNNDTKHEFIRYDDITNLFLIRDHKLTFYKNYMSNKNKNKPLKLSKDVLNIPVTDSINIKIELADGETAVEYIDYIVIYDKDKRKSKDIRLITNGLVLTALCEEKQSETFVFDTNGKVLNHIMLTGFTYPKLLDKSYFEPLSILPTLLGTANDDRIRLYYDDFGLLKSDSKRKVIYGTEETKSKQLYTSIHPLYYDNFDYNNYFTGYENCKWVKEQVCIDNNTRDIEYTRFIYSNEYDVKDN